MESSQKVQQFLRTALSYYGKEIALPSEQIFTIDKIVEVGANPDEDNFAIQYGFPQSGAVCMDFAYSRSNNEFYIDGVEVFAPPEGEDLVMASFTPHQEIDEIGISVNFGLDTGTIKHAKLEEIDRNPNALKLLDLAIQDLENAEVLGPCRVAVPEGSTRIPCTDSTSKPRQSGMQGQMQ